MKKILILFAAISMVLSLLVAPSNAVEVVTTVEQINTAITNGQNEIYIADNTSIDVKDVNFANADGTTFIGSVNSTLDFSNLSNEFVSDLKNITFEKLTIKHNNNSYVGMGRSNEKYIDCIIEGMIFTWGYSAKFIRCTFNQPDSANYNIWTYSANVDFEDCTFNSGGRSVLVWNDGSNGTKVNFENCDFNATQEAEGKSAIEIDSSTLPQNNKFEVSINNCTVNGFANGSVSGNPLWNNKTLNSDAAGSKRHDVIVDGVYVIKNGEVPVYTVSINGKGFGNLVDAIAAANSGDTIDLLDDIVLTDKATDKANIVIEKSLTINGNGHTVSSSSARANFRIGVTGNEQEALTVTFNNIKIVNNFYEGRCLETRRGDIKLNINDSTLTTKGVYGQTLTIGGNYLSKNKPVILNVNDSEVKSDTHYAILTFNPVQATINDSKLEGYAGLYFKGEVSSLGSEGSIVEINGGSILRGAAVAGETFGVVVFEDNNIIVNIADAKVEANGIKGSAYRLFSFSWLDYNVNDGNDEEVPVEGNTINLFRTDIYVSAEGATLTNQLTDNKVVVFEATSNVDLSQYVAEGSDQIIKDGKYFVCSHGLGDVVGEKNPTHTDKGYTGDVVCGVCGKVTEIGEEIPVLEHTHVLDKTTVKEVTCTTDGYTGDKKCECGDVVKGEVVKATGHLYVNGECSCGAKEEPKVSTEVEKLPVVDTKEPVEEVTVGTDETAKEVLNDTVETIIEKVEKGENVTAVSKEVVETIKEEVAKGNDVELVTEVVVKPVDEKEVTEETVQLIIETAKGTEIVQYLDLSVLVSVVVNDEVKATSEVTELTKPMTFTIAVPEEIAKVEEGFERTYYVIREHDGKTDKLPVKVNADGTLTFTTDKFSTYALVYVDTKVEDTTKPEVTPEVKPDVKPETKPEVETPKTTDNYYVVLYAIMALLSFAIMVVLKAKEELCK